MRKIFYILLVATLAGNINKSFSWDSTAAKYMPLQVGNLWVYYGESHNPISNGTGYLKYEITGTLDTLSKIYYKFRETRVIISGNGSWCRVMPEYLRIDSVNMNLYMPRNFCGGSETLVDSLLSGINDISGCPFKRCTDTSSYIIFNNSFPSKVFINQHGSTEIKYSSGIGPVRYFFGELMDICTNTLKGCIINGFLYGDTSMIVGINQINSEVPNNFSLSQNYPNPFNPTTHFEFRIADFGLVRLIVYNAIGEEIQTLVNRELFPGTYEADFDGNNLPSGVYYYQLTISNEQLSMLYSETKKMVLIK